MKIQENNPPREFEVGWGPKFIMRDCAHIELASNEQVTFKTEAGGEYDVARFVANHQGAGDSRRSAVQTDNAYRVGQMVHHPYFRIIAECNRDRLQAYRH